MEEDTKKMQTSFRYHRDSVFVVPTSPTAAKKSIENLKKSIDNLPKLFKSRKEDNQQNVQKTEDPISVDISIEVIHSKDKPPSPYFTQTSSPGELRPPSFTSKLARIKSFQEKPSGLNTGRIRSASFRGIERPYTENSDSIQDLNNQKPLPQKLDHNLPSRPRSSSFKNFVSPSTDKLDIPTPKIVRGTSMRKPKNLEDIQAVSDCNIGRTSSIKQLSLIKKEIAAGNWLKSCSSFASSIASSFSRNSSIDFARRSNSSMGSARSLKLQREESKKIDSYLAKEKQKFEKTKTEPRLLILGTSDSGKSTFLKQLKILHGHGFDESDLQEAKTQALGNIIAAAESLLFYCTESIQQKYSNILKFIAIEPGPFDALPLAMCRQLTSMWTDPAIQIVFQEHENSFSPNIYYFFDKIEDLGTNSYTMTNDDMLLLRTITCSISDTEFIIDSNVVHFIDVSGLKHHRKKWLQYFDDCLAVVFIVSLASYDQMMLEDSTSNRMKDALDLFEFICNNELLAKSDVIVFLNKFDVFKKKIQKTPIRNFFPDYNGDPNSYSDGLQYFKGKFESLNLSQSKTVSFHTTQCTNTSLMKKISADIVASLARQLSNQIGLL